MTRLLLILLLATAPVFTSCQSAPSERTATVHTLKAVGHMAEAAVELSARLYADGRITAQQARDVAQAYDLRFQPAFRVAVEAAKFDTSAASPQSLLEMAAELQRLVASYQ